MLFDIVQTVVETMFFAFNTGNNNTYMYSNALDASTTGEAGEKYLTGK